MKRHPVIAFYILAFVISWLYEHTNERMGQDAAHWLPRILASERLQAKFTFKADNETVDRVKIETWDSNGGN